MFDHFEDAYVASLKDVLAKGRHVSPRGKHTLELQPYMMTVHHPEHPWILNKNRHLNYAFGLAETLGYIGGVNSVEMLSFYNSNVKQFSDDGKTFDGHYGQRLMRYPIIRRMDDSNNFIDQIAWCLERLINDRDSRQAVATIWDPRVDLQRSKDIPCNVMVLFKIRDGQLNMTVIRRSSDIYLGVPYDHLFFWVLQRTMCNSLKDCSPGQIVEFSDSYHIYEQHVEKAKEIFIDHVPSRVTYKKPFSYPIADYGNLLLFTTVFMEKYEPLIRTDRFGACSALEVFIRTFSKGDQAFDPWWVDACTLVGAYALWNHGILDRAMYFASMMDMQFKKIFWNCISDRTSFLAQDPGWRENWLFRFFDER